MKNNEGFFSASLKNEDADWLKAWHRNRTDFHWNSKGSLSGKPIEDVYNKRDRIPNDSWTFLNIDKPRTKDETIRIRVDEIHVVRSGERYAGKAVHIDMDHNSARQLLAWLKTVYDTPQR